MSAESVLLEVCCEFTIGYNFPLRVSLQFGVPGGVLPCLHHLFG